MSSIKHIIDIQAPGYVQQRPQVLTQVLQCEACKGKGGHQVERYKNHFFNDPCKVCNGSGYVVATVQISFTPFGK